MNINFFNTIKYSQQKKMESVENRKF
jgi:hypothetical protein